MFTCRALPAKGTDRIQSSHRHSFAEPISLFGQTVLFFCTDHLQISHRRLFCRTCPVSSQLVFRFCTISLTGQGTKTRHNSHTELKQTCSPEIMQTSHKTTLSDPIQCIVQTIYRVHTD